MTDWMEVRGETTGEATDKHPAGDKTVMGVKLAKGPALLQPDPRGNPPYKEKTCIVFNLRLWQCHDMVPASIQLWQEHHNN